MRSSLRWLWISGLLSPVMWCRVVWYIVTNVSEELVTFILRVGTLLTLYHYTRRHTRENHNINSQQWEKLKSHMNRPVRKHNLLILPAACFLRVLFTLKMEAICSAESSECPWTTRRHSYRREHKGSNVLSESSHVLVYSPLWQV